MTVVYGKVETAAGIPVGNALVRAQVGAGVLPQPRLERTLTDDAGTFAFPLRWARADRNTTITAVDRRSRPARTGQIAIRVPNDLGRSHTIQVR